jgi:hypothetical protein
VDLFVDLRDASEFDARAAGGFVLWQSLFLVLCGEVIEVELQFVVEFPALTA